MPKCKENKALNVANVRYLCTEYLKDNPKEDITFV